MTPQVLIDDDDEMERHHYHEGGGDSTSLSSSASLASVSNVAGAEDVDLQQQGIGFGKSICNSCSKMFILKISYINCGTCQI